MAAMAIARELRSQRAENLASFMRGEKTNQDYLLREEELEVESSQADMDDLGAFYGIGRHWGAYGSEGTISVDESTWLCMTRWLAFFESDLELRSEDLGRERYTALRTFAVEAILIAIYVAACYALIGVGKAFFIIAWLGTGLIALGSASIFDRSRAWRTLGDPVEAFFQRQTWDEYAHLVRRFSLPPYDAAVHFRPVRWSVSRVIANVLCGAVFAFIFSLGSIFGPFVLLFGMARFERRRWVVIHNSRDNA